MHTIGFISYLSVTFIFSSVIKIAQKLKKRNNVRECKKNGTFFCNT